MIIMIIWCVQVAYMVQQALIPLLLYNVNEKSKFYPIFYQLLQKNTRFDNLNKMSKPIFNWAKIDGVIYFWKHGVTLYTKYKKFVP